MQYVQGPSCHHPCLLRLPSVPHGDQNYFLQELSQFSVAYSGKSWFRLDSPEKPVTLTVQNFGLWSLPWYLDSQKNLIDFTSSNDRYLSNVGPPPPPLAVPKCRPFFPLATKSQTMQSRAPDGPLSSIFSLYPSRFLTLPFSAASPVFVLRYYVI